MTFRSISRSSIVESACRHKHISPDEASDMLITLLDNTLRETDGQGHRNFYRQREIQICKKIVFSLHLLGAEHLAKLLKHNRTQERRLCSILYSATIRSQNFELWSATIDHLCCLAIISCLANSIDSVAYRRSRVVHELQKLAENFSASLERHSEAYRTLRKFL